MKKKKTKIIQAEMNSQPETIRKNYLGSKKLAEKVALITGGDSGIGRAVAIHFAREGADVAILYLNEDADAMETSGLIEAEGRRCLRIKGDAKRNAIYTKFSTENLITRGRTRP